jgi:hypothetical protein
MTELARTDPVSRRLFQEVDLAPLPRHRPIVLALDHWRRRRGRSLAPAAAVVSCGQFPEVAERSIVAEPMGSGRDFSLGGNGSAARHALGDPGGSVRLGEVPARRLAVRLRRLFALSGARGEPIDVHFSEGNRSYELLAAPVLTDRGLPGFFCTIAAQESRPAGNAR